MRTPKIVLLASGTQFSLLLILLQFRSDKVRMGTYFQCAKI